MPRLDSKRLGDYQKTILKSSRRNPISLRDDEPLDDFLKPLKIGDKNTPIALSDNEFRIDGNLHLDGELLPHEIRTKNTYLEFIAKESFLFSRLASDGISGDATDVLQIDVTDGAAIKLTGGTSFVFESLGQGGASFISRELTSLTPAFDDFPTICSISHPTIGMHTVLNNILEITNVVNASSMTGAGAGIAFNQYYYAFGGGYPDDIGTLGFRTEGNWTVTESTRDSKFELRNSLNGSLQTCLEISSGLTTTLYGDTTIPTTDKLYFDGGSDTYITESGADTLDFYVGADKMLALDEANDKITIGATNWVAGTVSAGTVTEFSSANSAYAGMILGCTIVGADVADDSYTLTTSYVCFEDSGNTPIRVSFKTPRSENVEIEVELYFSAGSGASDLELTLSNNATYGSNSLSHPDQFSKSVREPARGHSGTVTQKWYFGVGNLSAIGSFNHVFIAARCDSTVGTPILRWGGDATGEYTNLVLKATALPETIPTGS